MISEKDAESPACPVQSARAFRIILFTAPDRKKPGQKE
jgi:hypothetical protein